MSYGKWSLMVSWIVDRLCITFYYLGRWILPKSYHIYWVLCLVSGLLQIINRHCLFLHCLLGIEHNYKIWRYQQATYSRELMWQNCPFDIWHATMSSLRENEIYYESYLITIYSSQMEYLNDFFRIGWTKGMLCIL